MSRTPRRLDRAQVDALTPFVRRHCPPPCDGTFWCPVCCRAIEDMAQIIDGYLNDEVRA